MWVPGGLTNVVAITAGASHNLALKADGTVVAWGQVVEEQTTVPSGLSNVTAVAAARAYSMALLADGTVVTWGTYQDGGHLIPTPEGPTNAIAIAAGENYAVALHADGTVVGWPSSGDAWLEGLRNVTSIAVGHSHALASLADGSVVVRGDYWDAGGLYTMGVPPGLANVLAVSSGFSHCLALVGSGPPMLVAPLINRQAVRGGTVYWRATASGAWPLRYQWMFNGTELPSATNNLLVLTNLDPAQAGDYSVIVSNTLGRVASQPGRLTLVPALLMTQPQDRRTYLGGFATLSVEVQAAGLVAYQWRFNGTTLTGATNSTLALSNLQLDQSGTYSVDVSSDAGVVTSREARLDVGVVRAWGGGLWAQNPNYAKGLTNVLAVATGCGDSIALKDDGTVVGWSDDGGKHSMVYSYGGLTNIIGISAATGGDCTTGCVALRDDGAVFSWSLNGILGSGNPEIVIAGPTNIVAVADLLLVLTDGTVLSPFGSCPGLTNVVAIASGGSHALALKADGNVVTWGSWYNGTDFVPATVPADLTNVVAVACGSDHSLALTAEGQVVDWGYYRLGAGVLPAGAPPGLTNVVALAGGDAHSLALLADGTVVAWGQYYNDDDTFVPATVPGDLGVVSSLASGGMHWLAIIGEGPPVVSASLSNATRTADGFSVSVPTQSGRVYALEYKQRLADAVWTPLPLVAGTGRERTLTDPTATGGQRFYRVRRW